jgi:hypothetical protein
MHVSKLLGIATFAAVLFAQGGHAFALTVSSSASVSSAKGSNTSIAFTGGSGTYTADGDKIVVKDGIITVNGVSYGKVTNRSRIQYNIRDGKKTLTVDGAERKPAK